MIETTIEAGIGTVRLASPATANALTPAAFAELTAQILAVQRPDSGARVLVLTGSGKVFSAGANMDVLGGTDTTALAGAITAALLPLQQALQEGRLPTVAAVNGAAVGGAVGLALLCDIVIAARSARFSMAFARLGLVPDTGLTLTLPRLVGEARAHRAGRHVQRVERRIELDQQPPLETLEDVRVGDRVHRDRQMPLHPGAQIGL